MADKTDYCGRQLTSPVYMGTPPVRGDILGTSPGILYIYGMDHMTGIGRLAGVDYITGNGRGRRRTSQSPVISLQYIIS